MTKLGQLMQNPCNVKIHLDISVNCGSTSNVQKLNLEMSIYTVNTVLQASVPSM